jgi:hypothetical protein
MIKGRTEYTQSETGGILLDASTTEFTPQDDDEARDEFTGGAGSIITRQLIRRLHKRLGW